MALRNAIHNCLLADARVTALIGIGDVCRHYPGRAPQIEGDGELAFVVSSEVYGQAASTHGLPDDSEDTMDETQIQFSCYAKVFEDAVALRNAVRAALLEDLSDVLSIAKVIVTAPQTRELHEDAVDMHCAQLDATFFHNPNT